MWQIANGAVAAEKALKAIETKSYTYMGACCSTRDRERGTQLMSTAISSYQGFRARYLLRRRRWSGAHGAPRRAERLILRSFLPRASHIGRKTATSRTWAVAGFKGERKPLMRTFEPPNNLANVLLTRQIVIRSTSSSVISSPVRS